MHGKWTDNRLGIHRQPYYATGMAMHTMHSLPLRNAGRAQQAWECSIAHQSLNRLLYYRRLHLSYCQSASFGGTSGGLLRLHATSKLSSFFISAYALSYDCLPLAIYLFLLVKLFPATLASEGIR
jgi:hypothetical protein